MATQQEIERYLPDAIERVYGNVADCAGAQIIAWRHATQPQPTDLSALVDAHLAYLETDRPRREAISRASLTFSILDRRYQALGKQRDAQIALVIDQLINRQNNPTAQMTEFRTEYAAAKAEAEAAILALRRT